jgi:hypothetical protein
MDIDISSIDFEDIIKKCYVCETQSPFYKLKQPGIDYVLLECYVANKGWNVHHYHFIKDSLYKLGYSGYIYVT